jgi:hypothetical protein
MSRGYDTNVNIAPQIDDITTGAQIKTERNIGLADDFVNRSLKLTRPDLTLELVGNLTGDGVIEPIRPSNPHQPR